MFIGIDIGGTNIKGILTDNNGNVINMDMINTGSTVNEIENNIIKLFDSLVEKANENVLAAGIGSAGTIDKNKGVIISSPNIKCFTNYNLKDNLEKRLNIPIYIDNDANAALYGELWTGYGKLYKNWIILTLGTGIGGGAVINNKVYSELYDNSMEFGHMTIDYNGYTCKCGKKGCFENYASASAVVRFAIENIENHPDSIINNLIRNNQLNSKTIYEAGLKNDKFAIEIFQKIGYFLAIGLSNIVNIFNPEAIILAGGLTNASDLFFDETKKTLFQNILAGFAKNLNIHISNNKTHLAAIGAAKIALNNYKKIGV